MKLCKARRRREEREDQKYFVAGSGTTREGVGRFIKAAVC